MLQPRTNHHSMTRTGLALAVGVSLIVGLPIASATTAAAPIATPIATPIAAPAVAPTVAETTPMPATTPSAPAPAPSPVVTRPVAATRPAVTPPQPAPTPAVVEQLASIAGRIVDETGGVIPGANVTVKDQAGNTNQVYTRATGQFTFSDLQPGPYELTITLPGFKTAVARLTLMGGQTSEPLITLAVGALSEQIAVGCAAPSSLGMLAKLIDGLMPTVHAQAGSTPIRVGGNVRPPKRTHYVQPACPPGVGSPETTVVLAGSIDATGKVDVAPAPGAQAPIDAVNAALDAVRRWEYTPTLLNGKPVAVEIFVTLRFTK